MSSAVVSPDLAHLQLVLARCEHSLAAWLDMLLDCTLPTWYMKLYVHRMIQVSEQALRAVGNGNPHSLVVGPRLLRVLQWIGMRSPRVSWHDFVVHRLLRDLPVESIPLLLPDADGEYRDHDWVDEELSGEAEVPAEVWALPMPLLFADPVITGDATMPELIFLPEEEIPAELRVRKPRVGLPEHLRNIQVEVVMPPLPVAGGSSANASAEPGEIIDPACTACIKAAVFPCRRKYEGAACFRCRSRKQPCSVSDGKPGRRKRTSV